MSVVHKGKLMIFKKDDKTGNKSWTKRVCELTDLDDIPVILYSREDGKGPQMKITLTGSLAEVDKRRGDKNQFIVKDTPRGVFYFRARNEKEMWDWIDRINDHVASFEEPQDEGGDDGYDDYDEGGEYGDDDAYGDDGGYGDEDYEEEYYDDDY